MLKYSASELIRLLGLVQHPEGGHYKEMYRSGCKPDNSDAKPFMCWVWTTSDIMYFWHGGVTVKYHILDPITGGYECIYLGPNLVDGNTMQMSIKGGLYKCAELIDTNSIEDYGLLAEAVSPGFDYQDFGFVNEDQLSAVAPPDKLEYLKQFLKVTFLAYKTSGARIDVE